MKNPSSSLSCSLLQTINRLKAYSNSNSSMRF